MSTGPKPKAFCRVCRKSVTIRVDGRLGAHKYAAGTSSLRGWCPGSHRTPSEGTLTNLTPGGDTK